MTHPLKGVNFIPVQVFCRVINAVTKGPTALTIYIIYGGAKLRNIRRMRRCKAARHYLQPQKVKANAYGSSERLAATISADAHTIIRSVGGKGVFEVVDFFAVALDYVETHHAVHLPARKIAAGGVHILFAASAVHRL